MHLVADESVDGELVAALEQAGHRVIYIAHELHSIKDPQVLAFATSRDEVLITEDKDFGEIVHRLRHAHAGVVLLRLNELSTPSKIARTLMVISAYEAKLKDAFTTITATRVRSRGPYDVR